MDRKNMISYSAGFTFIEIIIVVAIMSIIALLAIPMFSSAADIQLRTAANVIAADLEYVKNLAITRQQYYSVVFDTDAETFEVRDNTGTVINHPVNVGKLFSVNFSADSRTEQVDIVSVDFNGAGNTAVTFDYLGSPYSGVGTAAPLNTGQINLSAEGFNMIVTIEPVTGYVTIQ